MDAERREKTIHEDQRHRRKERAEDRPREEGEGHAVARPGEKSEIEVKNGEQRQVVTPYGLQGPHEEGDLPCTRFLLADSC